MLLATGSIPCHQEIADQVRDEARGKDCQKPKARGQKQQKYTTMEKKEPQVRYSDEDLEEFKALILEKLEQAKASL